MAVSLVDCEWKLRRVEQQFEHLKILLDAFTKDNPDPVTRKYGIKRREIRFRVGKFSAVPPMVSLFAGEMLHNMRSPLDYLVCRLVERAGNHPTNRNEFPIVESSKEFSRVAPMKLLNVPPLEIALIESVQPYHGHYGKHHPLAILQALNNTDKHRLLPLCGIGAHEGSYKVLGPIQPSKVKPAAATTTFLQSGSHLLTLEFPDGVDVRKMDVQVTLACDVEFDKATPLRGLSLFQTLLSIRAYLHQSIFVDPIIAGFDWDLKLQFPIKKPWHEHLPPPGGPKRII